MRRAMSNFYFENLYAGLFISEWKNVDIEDRKSILEKAKYKSFKDGRKKPLFAASFFMILVIYFILFGLVPIIYFETHLIVPISVVFTTIFSLITYPLVNFLIIKKEIINTLKN
jgi:hypothetical protein